MSRGTLAITGATGFVGQTLVRMALEGGWRVRALTRSPKPSSEGLSWIDGSLEDAASLAELMRGSDAVIHVAGVVNAAERAGFAKGNIEGTRAVVEAAKSAGIRRFVHVSSISAREPALSNYSWSKSEAERVITQSTLDWTIIRPPAIFGIGDYEINELFKFAKIRLCFGVFSCKTSVIAVEDLAEILLKCIWFDSALRVTYEVDDGHYGGRTQREFGQLVLEATSKIGVSIPIPAFFVPILAYFDTLKRKEKAKLTKDRACYMIHRDWVANSDLKPPISLWNPRDDTAEKLKIAYIKWYKFL
jgi:uncharacterized protein YbjT (DUF2867 family)